MLILGIETSCDETSVSIVEDGKKILTLSTFSQIDIHKNFNGVVPEVASRNHLVKIIDVLEEGLGEKCLSDMDAFAATNGPGLLGSLLVGTNFAKSLALYFNKPYIPVNHIMAHMYSPHLENEIEFPYIGLVVSGGHTILFYVKSFTDIEFLGSTIDDAIGEAFDKVAKYLNLGYPGGPVIDKLAQDDEAVFLEDFKDISLPLSTEKDRYNFSYSGLKTAIVYKLKKIEVTEKNIKSIAKTFQELAIKHLLDKTMNAINDLKINRLVISGGVSANSFLRKSLDEIKTKNNIQVYSASLALCSDNAAMVAGRAFVDYLNNKENFNIESLRSKAFSRLSFVKKGKR